MAREPGNLRNLGKAGRAAWDALVAGSFDTPSRHLLSAADARTREVIPVEWGAYADRVRTCLQSLVTSERLLDWTGPAGDVGRARLQEEYFEWRTVRNTAGTIVRFEATTEFPEYWRVLAAYHPRTTLRLVASFAREPSVPPAAVYGELNPFARGVTPEARGAAFMGLMAPRKAGALPASDYNNGRRAICFMVHRANTLGALVSLVATAAAPWADMEGRRLSGPQAIASSEQAAQACRNSDPTVVGSCIRLAFDGRVFALDDPIGVYIRSVQNDQLAQPDGSPVPLEWFSFERGTRPSGARGLERCQRLVFEVPPGEGFAVGDLRDTATGRPIEHGGQVAQVVQLGGYVRVSPPGAIPVRQRRVQLKRVVPCERDPGCREVRSAQQDFERG